HLVDVGPYSDSGDPLRDITVILAELGKYSAELAERERWLVLNKLDLFPPDERAARMAEVTAALEWTGPVFGISAANGEGTDVLIEAVMTRLEEERADAATDASSEQEE
ncbi:MAG: GTPase ObgE, partial [Phycisphaerales bacterium]|nr:GTPase ObgE [Phycisphaerales bacterium]